MLKVGPSTGDRQISGVPTLVLASVVEVPVAIGSGNLLEVVAVLEIAGSGAEAGVDVGMIGAICCASELCMTTQRQS